MRGWCSPQGTRWSAAARGERRSSGGLGRVLHGVEHAEGFLQMRLEVGAHEGEDLENDGVADRVKDLVAGLPVDDNLFGAQDGEVLGDVGLLHAEFFDQCAGREFTIAKEFEDGDAGGVSEGLEDVGLELPKGVWHTSILLYSHID